jgi:hypothetical protein
MIYLSLNDADENWDYAMRRKTLEISAGVACEEPVAVQGKREGDPVWARLMLAVGVVFLGSAIIYFSTVVLR